MTEREPQIREDPRRQGTGEGLPESNPEEQTPVEGTEVGPEAGEAKEPSGNQEPWPSGGDKESPPSKATGNPNAAGG
jgi:hypothetical protein